MPQWFKKNKFWIIWSLFTLLWIVVSFCITHLYGYWTRGLALLLASPLAIVGLYFSSKRTAVLESQNTIDSDRLLAETFAKSIELLGSEKKEVKQGAIYALGKIAETNPAELPVIVNTLCAFIRHNKLRQSNKAPKSDQTTDNLAIDIEAAVKVISTISKKIELEDGRSKRKYDLSNIHLSYADFSGANLSHFNLSDSVFKKCIFENVKFFNSNLVSSKFKGSNFKGAKFDEKTETKGADFKDTKVNEEMEAEGADFSKAKNHNWEEQLKLMYTRKSALNWCQKKYGNKPENIRASRLFKPNNASVKEHCWWVEFSESKMIKGESQNLLLQKDFDDDGEFHHLEIPNEFLIKNKDGLGYRQDIASFSFMISAEKDSFMDETRGKDKINLSEFIQKNNKG